MSKRAVILAGGKGTRLIPYSVSLPKPLVPLGEKPILELVIVQLGNHGFDHITIAVNHFAEIIKAFFGDGSKWGIKIDYSFEDKPLSTMGPLKLIHNLPENFMVMNGDILTDLNFSDIFNYHLKHQNIFTISSAKREQINDYGVIKVNKSDNLIGFTEKPVSVFNVSMGIYIVNKKVLDVIPDNKAYGFDNLMIDLIERKETVSVKEHQGYWLDIGRPEDYAKACNDFESGKLSFV